MRLALPWIERKGYYDSRFPIYRRYSIRNYPLVEIVGYNSNHWEIVTYSWELPIINLSYDTTFLTLNEAKHILDEALVKLGYELISTERADKLRLLI